MDNIKRELAMFANIVKQALPSKSSWEGPSTQPIATALLAPIQVATYTSSLLHCHSTKVKGKWHIIEIPYLNANKT